jgi:hypothetical protein
LNESPEPRRRIEDELEQLEAEVAGVRPLLETLAHREPDDIEMRAAALTLHGFYNGVEGVLLTIAKRFDRQIPGGTRWHRHLLDQMKTATELRSAVIGEQEYDMLVEYLSFRHMVRHSYPGTLRWERFREVALSLSDSHRRIDHCIRRFLESISDNGNGGLTDS